MIIYNTTFHIANEVSMEGIEYLKKRYIPQATAGGLLNRPRMSRVLGTGNDDGESISVQFHVENIAVLDSWLKQEGKVLHQALINKFGSRMAGFSTLLEEIDLQIG